MARLKPGVRVPARTLSTIKGEVVSLPDPGGLTHLQFRRFAGCPVCSLHLRSFVMRREEIAGAGVREVVLFHSSAAALRTYAGDLPLAVVADPDKRLYAEYGVEASSRALLNPRSWGVIARSVWASLVEIILRRAPTPSMNPEGGRYGLPADFLIGPDGAVLACRYGEHLDDNWSVDDLLALAEAARPAGQAQAAE